MTASTPDWRRFESELNSFPQFVTTIDGVDIHLIHVRSGTAKQIRGWLDGHDQVAGMIVPW